MSLPTSPSGFVSFFPSQVGHTSQTPVAYTDDPLKLLWSDFKLVCRVWTTMPGIMWPLRFGKEADAWDELYPNKLNMLAMALHAFLIPLQILFLMSIPVILLLQVPGLWVIAYVGGFIGINTALCKLINGNKLVLEPSKNIVFPPRDDEYWIYLNGVSVGRDWLQSNIDRLSLTFGRRVVGVHNPTDGIVFDLIQCLIQRNFCYSTEDIRAAYVKIKDALLQPHVRKVVFILHSQGGIEGGLIIDWLLAELPQDCCQKLEVYTFGNAANHFNNPVRSGAEIDGAGGASSSKVGTGTAATKKFQRSHAIRHIEHYANRGDFVSQFGVLAYSSVSDRFMGRLFVSPASGHLLNQHYLHAMFPLAADGRTCCDSNAFMDMDVDITAGGEDGGEDRDGAGRESVATSLASAADGKATVALVADADRPVSPIKRTWSLKGDATHPPRRLKVKDFSRLWHYRNGGLPPDDKDGLLDDVAEGAAVMNYRTR